MNEKIIFLLRSVIPDENIPSKLVWAENEEAARTSIVPSAKVKLPGAITEYLSEKDFPYQDRQKVVCQKLESDQYEIDDEDEEQINILYQSEKYGLVPHHPVNIKK